MNSWYATVPLFKYLIGEGKTFYCPIKANRKIDDTRGEEPYKQAQEAFWSDLDVARGKRVKLHRMPADTYFKLLESTGLTDQDGLCYH
jgi:hypothetical protein